MGLFSSLCSLIVRTATRPVPKKLCKGVLLKELCKGVLLKELCKGVLLKELWTVSYRGLQPATVYAGAVGELKFFGMCKPTFMRDR